MESAFGGLGRELNSTQGTYQNTSFIMNQLPQSLILTNIHLSHVSVCATQLEWIGEFGNATCRLLFLLTATNNKSHV